MGGPRVTEAGESLFAVALDQSVDSDPVVPGHLKDLRHEASFCEECEELGSASFDGTGTGINHHRAGCFKIRNKIQRC